MLKLLVRRNIDLDQKPFSVDGPRGLLLLRRP